MVRGEHRVVEGIASLNLVSFKFHLALLHQVAQDGCGKILRVIRFHFRYIISNSSNFTAKKSVFEFHNVFPLQC